MEEKLKQLISLKIQNDLYTEDRKARQDELLSWDEFYQNLLKQEKEIWKEYEEMRAEVIKEWKEKDLNGNIKTDNWSVTFSYVRQHNITNEDELLEFCKKENLVENIYKLTVKTKEFKSFVSQRDMEGQTTPWVSSDDNISITVFTW